MFDGTIAKAHRCAAGARGGLTTKICAAVCTTTQKIIRVVLAPGQRNDCTLATAPLRPIEGAVIIADKAFGIDATRSDLAARGCTAVIPSKASRRQPQKANKALYRWRHGIENVLVRANDVIRITLRRDKTHNSYVGFLHLACAVLNIRRDAVLAKEA